MAPPPVNILFICAGNLMRSVISECLLFARAHDLLGPVEGLFTAESCGLEAVPDMPPHDDAVAALEHLGVPLVETGAVRADEDLLARCDLAVTMTRQQSYILASRFPADRRKYFSLMELNGAVETLLLMRSTGIDERDWTAEARRLEPGDLMGGLELAVAALHSSTRETMRPLAGVPLSIVELLTLFSPCFHQVSGVHDPIGGTREETFKCAAILDREVTLLLRGLIALAVTEVINGIRHHS